MASLKGRSGSEVEGMTQARYYQGKVRVWYG